MPFVDPLEKTDKGTGFVDPLESKSEGTVTKASVLSRLAKGVWEDITDIVKAPSMIRSMGALVEGGIETGIRAIKPSGPAYPPSEKAQAFQEGIVEPIKKNIQDPLGIPGRALDYAIEHPVKTAMTISGGLSAVGKATGMSAISKAGELTNPIELGMRAAEFTGKKAIAPILGSRPLTGVETETILRAAKGSKEFAKGMRGNISPEEIFNEANSALGKMKIERGAEYRVELNAIKRMVNPPKMDLMRPLQTFSDSLKDHNVSIMRNKTTGEMKLDFSRSALRNNTPAQKDLTSLLDTMRNAFNDPGYYKTPEGFDILKRQVGEMFSESHQGRTVVENLYDSIRGQLVNKVPRYKDMVGNYEQTTKLIKEIKSDLSVGGKPATQAAIRRLLSATRDNNDFRRSLVQKLESAGGDQLLDQIAGYNMKGIIPTQHGGTQLAAAEILAAAIGGNPKVLLGILAGSPRLVGETLNVMGRAINLYRKTGAPSPSKIGRGVIIGTQILQSQRRSQAIESRQDQEAMPSGLQE